MHGTRARTIPVSYLNCSVDVHKVGLAFASLEGARERFKISDYAVAQPTLEQVFVRTVNTLRVAGIRGGRSCSRLSWPCFVCPRVRGCECVWHTRRLSAAWSPPGCVCVCIRHQVMEHSEFERPAPLSQELDTIDGQSKATGASMVLDPAATRLGAAGSGAVGSGAAPGGFPTAFGEESSGGLRTECCGLNRRSHRFLATASGLLAFLMFLTMSGALGPAKHVPCHHLLINV